MKRQKEEEHIRGEGQYKQDKDTYRTKRRQDEENDEGRERNYKGKDRNSKAEKIREILREIRREINSEKVREIVREKKVLVKILLQSYTNISVSLAFCTNLPNLIIKSLTNLT